MSNRHNISEMKLCLTRNLCSIKQHKGDLRPILHKKDTRNVVFNRRDSNAGVSRLFRYLPTSGNYPTECEPCFIAQLPGLCRNHGHRQVEALTVATFAYAKEALFLPSMQNGFLGSLSLRFTCFQQAPCRLGSRQGFRRYGQSYQGNHSAHPW